MNVADQRRKAEIAVTGRKTCDCGAEFPVEFNTKGQMTSRRLCDVCRRNANKRLAADLAHTAGVPRCAECSALVGLEWGTVTHLDAAGRCPSCAAYLEARRRKAERVANGEYSTGGLWFGKPLLRRPVRPPRPPKPAEAQTLVTLVAATGAEFGCAAEDILGPSRRAELTALRFGVWRALHFEAQWTMTEIARAFNRSQHGTVTHGVRQRRPETLKAEAVALPYAAALRRKR